MGIYDLTISEVQQVMNLIKNPCHSETSLNRMIGEYVLVKTHSTGSCSGLWCGTLDQKAGSEVILTDARRMLSYWPKKGRGLSSIALYGIAHNGSKIVEPLEEVWLKALEIIPTTSVAQLNLEEAPYYEPENSL